LQGIASCRNQIIGILVYQENAPISRLGAHRISLVPSIDLLSVKR
jgi:hypothetical protein